MITAEAVINLKALSDNYDNLKARCKGNKLIAVIKGDAYGHDAVKVATALPQADMFAVSRIEEAIELRDANIKQPILLLEGCFCQTDLELASRHNIHTAIHCESQLADLQNAHIDTPINVWVKVDTGMHRLGVQPEELDDVVSRIEASGKASTPVGFMSHFCCADDLSSPTTQKQLEIFLACTRHHPGPKTLANSAGILYWDTSIFDYSRGGIALYGVSPNDNVPIATLGLKPVMTLKTKLIAVRKHRANEPVGYGETWTSERDTTMGVVAMGYGDGFPRNAPAGTPVYINGRRVPICGRVSMDMITVDLGPNCTDKVGDNVEFWGNHLPIETVAIHLGTISYELLIKLTKRVHKTFIER